MDFKPLKKFVYGLNILLAIIICSCSSGTQRTTETGVDLAPDAKLLRLSDRDGYTVAEFFSPADSVTPKLTYLLVPDSIKDVPSTGGIVIRTPIKSALIYSSVTAGALDELGSFDVIKGVTDAQYFTDPRIKSRIASGRIVDAGAAATPSREKLLALSPDCIILNLYEGMDVTGIDGLGIPVIKMVDNQENTPLGRAEWIKLIGALTGKQTKAESIYSTVKSEYTALSQATAKLNNRPKVLTENMYQGIWYVPGGNSFQARLIKDAGGNYFKSDDKSSGSLSLSYEQVFADARDADVWLLKLFGVEASREELLKMDNRYVHFDALDKKNVFYVNTEETPLFNFSVYHPEKVLAEYAAIFKAVAENKEPQGLKYYRRMK